MNETAGRMTELWRCCVWL